jgi:hypothetical protein
VNGTHDAENMRVALSAGLGMDNCDPAVLDRQARQLARRSFRVLHTDRAAGWLLECSVPIQVCEWRKGDR